MICPKCNSQNVDDARFCASCGTPLTQSRQSTYSQALELQPQTGNTYSKGYKANITYRNIVTAIILSIVTCGIYGIYWNIVIVDDLNTAAKEPNATSGVMVFVFTLLTCGIYAWYWFYKAGGQVDKIRLFNGESNGSNGLVYLLLALFGFSIVNYCLIQSELNKVAVNQ